MKTPQICRLGALVALAGLFVHNVSAIDYEAKPADPYYAKFNLRRAPAPGPLLLQPGDRLAIVGDSITQQQRYSRIIETYLTVCVPELKITARQFGWNGETAEVFRRRMAQDCLRFKPTIATFCYGMNDAKYRAYDGANGKWYASNYTAVVEAFKSAGARVVLGSPGCLGKLGTGNKAIGTLDEHNLNLGTLRDMDIRIAEAERVRFADVFWPLLQATHEGAARYGTTNQPFELTGPDGIHPDWAGHLIMARSFLLALGLNGDIGTFTVDFGRSQAEASAGHKIDSFANHELTITSSRYPFCDAGATNQSGSIRAGMTLAPFNLELNRLMLIVTNLGAPRCQVTWGSASQIYTAEQLAAGVNLADDFASNPFSPAFRKVDDAVAAKQKYETHQIHDLFHSQEARTNMEAVVTRSEAERAPLADAIAAAFVPVQHTLRLTPVKD
jgi:lysophospholipase L1-like esterase